jgi:hypothetical protein
VEWFERAIEADQYFAVAHFAKGFALYYLGDLEGTVDAYNNVLVV